MSIRPDPAPCAVDPAATAGSASAATVLDAEAMQRLHELDPGDRAGIVARVLCTFEASLQRLMTQFDAARPVQDLAVLRHVAHTLRSSSASVGALALSRCCLEVETHIREQRGGDLGPALDALAAEAARAGAAVRAMLQTSGSSV
jgi:HPt (histidine-containing phosphotransfer) domain-containing protein